MLTKNEKESSKKKIKVEYRIEMILGMIGGVILIITGAIGSARFYVLLIQTAERYLGLSATRLKIFEFFFRTLAGLGGVTVIVGSIMIGLGHRRIGGWFIGIGAGISLSTLLVKIVLLGPFLQELVKSQKFVEAITLFGFEIGLTGLGVFLSFLSMLTNYNWMLFLFILSILAMFIGATGDVSLLEKLLVELNLPPDYLIYLNYIETLLLYIGLVFLITTLVVGAGRFFIAKIIVLLGLISLLPAVITITTTLAIINAQLLELTRTVATYLLLIGEIIFIIKAKPAH